MISSLSRAITHYFVSPETNMVYWIEGQRLMAAPTDQNGNFHTDNACQVDYHALAEKELSYVYAVGHLLAHKRQDRAMMSLFLSALMLIESLHSLPISNDNVRASTLDFALPAKIAG